MQQSMRQPTMPLSRLAKPQTLKQPRTFMSAPKRNFNQKFERGLQRLLDRLPGGGDIGLTIAGINTLVYGLYNIWPAHNTFAFMNNFTYSTYGFSRGYIWNIFTCHFTNLSFFSFLIDTGICYLLCQNLTMMHGSLYVAKTVLLSMLLGSAFTFLHHTTHNITKPFHGNESILRGLIFTIIFSNPQASLMLFPIPVNIPAWGIGAFILVIDFLGFRTASFGGITAAYLLTAGML